MNAWQIILDELKAAGLEMAEEDVKILIKVLFEKGFPRIGLESTNPTIKAIFLACGAFTPAIEKVLLDLADKIDGQEG